MVRKSAITSMFAGSPVRPLQQHMEKVCECTSQLPSFFKAMAAQKFDDATAIQKKISKLENEADTLKHKLRMNLPNSLFMPMPREQILDIVTQQDKIANMAKDIAGIMLGRKMQMPESISELFIAFVECSVQASEQAKKAINELDELVEAGFRGGEVTVVQDMIKDLDKTEYESDKFEQQIRHALFAIEKEYPPIDMMFLYRMIDWTGELADISQRVGSRLQLLLAR
ncbi:MAG TPA: TIGR00153 family protein [Mariprofundaceae bacterium]|nr:TIGR00153 family protein [Mariprofundaceae bacterium]